MLDGKANKYTSGGNVEREKFNKKASAPKAETKAKAPMDAEPDGDEPTTTITHHADGTHSAQHSDGESSDHPNLGHLAMHMHAKHEGGEAGHIHKHDSGATTHHVGMDGQVEGPHEHGSVGEAADHMKSMLGEDGGNASMEQAGMSGGHQGGMDLY